VSAEDDHKDPFQAFNINAMPSSLDVSPMKLPSRLALASVPALLALFPFGLLPDPVLAQSIVCKSPSFGQGRGNPDFRNCAGATGEQQIYWVPGIRKKKSGTSKCVSTGNVYAALLTNPNPTIVNLLNLVPTRRASVTGNGNANVLVGSPGTSDRLSGGGGYDTYIVGGLDATIVVAPDDIPTTYGTSSENDIITFGASQEYIYINTPSGDQNNPGPVATPPSSGLGTVTPGGAAGVPGVQRNQAQSKTTCLATVPPGSKQWPEGLKPLLLAWLPSTSPSDNGGLLSQLAPTLDPGQGGRPMGSDPDNQYPIRRGDVVGKGFPGAPTLVGFGLEPENADRIFVPARDFSFQGIPINRFIKPGQPIPLLVVDEVSINPGGVVSPERIKALLANAKGLAKVRSDEAPLVYFRRDGLLVFSQNAQPLGSRENPGRVLAQLLDGKGRPLPLAPSPGQRFYEATFLEFLPSERPSKP
jgi:hypothetical protein